MVVLGGGNAVNDHENVLKSLHEHTLSYCNAMSQGKDNNLYWVSPSQQRPDIGYLYMLTPIYIGNKLESQVGIEQTIRLEDFVTTGNLPISVTLLDENNEPILRLADGVRSPTSLKSYPDDPTYFGYVDNYCELIMKRMLPPS